MAFHKSQKNRHMDNPVHVLNRHSWFRPSHSTHGTGQKGSSLAFGAGRVARDGIYLELSFTTSEGCNVPEKILSDSATN